MKRYQITQTSEFGVYSRDDHLLVHITIKDTLTSAPSDPSSVSIAIISPCDVSIVTATMSKATTGVYFYDYDFSSTTTYGVYEVQISTATYPHLESYNFVVMPWNINAQVRRLSGIMAQNDVTDYLLAQIIWDAYMETLETIYDLHDNECVLSNPSTCVLFNGINKRVRVKSTPIADINGDTVFTGYLQQTCGEDITGYWIDSNYVYQTAKINVINEKQGIIDIMQIGGAAIPDDNRGVRVRYWTSSPSYDERLMREAVAYLAAHHLILAFQSLYKTTLADLQTNEQKLVADMNRLKNKFDNIVEIISTPMIGGVK